MIIQIGSEGKGDIKHTKYTQNKEQIMTIFHHDNELTRTIIKILFTGYVT